MGTVDTDIPSNTVWEPHPVALRRAAQSIDSAADHVLGLIPRLQFDSSVAGRLHTAAGGAVRSAAEQVVGDARRWALAAREAAGALRLGADRHADQESAAVAVLR